MGSIDKLLKITSEAPIDIGKRVTRGSGSAMAKKTTWFVPQIDS